MDILNRTFTTYSVALAANCKPKNISDWCNVGNVIGQRKNVGTGNRRALSWFNLMEVAIATEVLKITPSVQFAFEAAQSFAHLGEGQTGSFDDAANDHEPRIPGLPWHHSRGHTLLAIWHDGSRVVLNQQFDPVTVTGGDNLADPPPAFVVVNVTRIFQAVCDRLALLPSEILDEAYPETAKG